MAEDRKKRQRFPFYVFIIHTLQMKSVFVLVLVSWLISAPLSIDRLAIVDARAATAASAIFSLYFAALLPSVVSSAFDD